MHCRSERGASQGARVTVSQGGKPPAHYVTNELTQRDQASKGTHGCYICLVPLQAQRVAALIDSSQRLHSTLSQQPMQNLAYLVVEI